MLSVRSCYWAERKMPSWANSFVTASEKWSVQCLRQNPDSTLRRARETCRLHHHPRHGLMHIAAAFGKRIVSVWGNTIPNSVCIPKNREAPNRFSSKRSRTSLPSPAPRSDTAKIQRDISGVCGIRISLQSRSTPGATPSPVEAGRARSSSGNPPQRQPPDWVHDHRHFLTTYRAGDKTV